MRSRIAFVVTAALAAAAVTGMAALALFGGSGEIPTALTSTTTTSTTTTTTQPPTTTTEMAAPSPTTTGPPAGATLDVLEGGDDADLSSAVESLYDWMSDPRAPMPHMLDRLAEYLRQDRTTATLHLEVTMAQAVLPGDARVAVAVVGPDVVLAADEGDGWQIVGARLTTFGIEPWYGDPVRHVLIIGTDARPHQSQPDFRADSIHIVAANLEARAGGIVGFPRDTYVDASYGSDRFSSVNVRGSTEEMVEIAEDLSGVRLEGYILTGFAGFKRLVNRVGGIEVDVPFRMSDDSSKAFLEAGLQVLKGGDALAFSRNRHITGGDFTRSGHQGDVITAALTGIQATGIQSLPRLLRILTDDAWTDLSATRLLQLGAIAYEIDSAAVGNVVLPGTVTTINRASVVRLTSAADDVFDDLVDGVISGG